MMIMEKSTSSDQHNKEIHENQQAWKMKPLLADIYDGFYSLIRDRLAPQVSGLIVELGSGMGNIKRAIPECITTDLFPNPWLDRQENAYRLSFANASVSNLILFDVWHHLEHPATALLEFARVLKPGGRLILFEPGMGYLGRFIYRMFHHEPLGWKHQFQWHAGKDFNLECAPYFAAQASADRAFCRKELKGLEFDWETVEVSKISSLAYVASGGFSGRQLYPRAFLPLMRLIDRGLGYMPGLFATRMLVVLERKKD